MSQGNCRRVSPKKQQQSKIFAGILIIIFGVLFLLRRIGVEVPSWIFSWKVFLIGMGLVVLYKHSFRNFGGYVMVTVGSVFIINDYYRDLIDVNLLFPIFIILFGVIMVGKSLNLFQKKKTKSFVFENEEEVEGGDFVEATALFGNVKKNIVSKDFKGADLSTIFGGIQLNLIKADIQGPVTINSDVIFGGMKLYIPPTWDLKIETTAIFGGVEDKRPILDNGTIDPNKTIILTGNCIFGGVEIVNYF